MRIRLLLNYSSTLLAVVLAIVLGTTAARGQTTSFTYQGRLTDGGTAANGNYDLQFALWDSLSGGTQIGSTQTLTTVAVSNGVFTVTLDFGASGFPGANRFLEISARPAGSGSFTLLTPRQQITSTPYAFRSLNASTADSVPASGVPAGSGNYIQNTNSTQTGNFNISGNGTLGGTLTAGNVNVNGNVQWGGTTADFVRSGQDAGGVFLEQKGSSPAKSGIRLQSSKSGDLANYSQFFIDPNNGFSFGTLGTGNGNVGIGTTTPQAKLDVRGDVRLGPSGQYRAVSGEENLRIIRGIVSGAGAIIGGSGFSVEHPSAGRYTILFDTSFSGTPSVTANAVFSSPCATSVTLDPSLGINSARANLVIWSCNGSENLLFHFIAIGAR